MITVYKYALFHDGMIADRVAIALPTVHTLLHVGLDPIRTWCIWAQVDTAANLELRQFYIVGTGHAVPESISEKWQHVGSFVDGAYVWHVFTDIRYSRPPSI